MSGVDARSVAKPGWLPRRLRSAIIGLLVLGVGGFLIDGANRPANPYLLPANGQTGRAALSSFGTASLSIIPASGPKRSVCTLEASTEAERERGLMGQRSLHGFAGMVFVFGQPSNDVFYMKDTLIPLSVAWFDPAGVYIGSAMMPPCRTATMCPTYAASRAYDLAVEVPAGGLEAIGIGPGARVVLGGPCNA